MVHNLGSGHCYSTDSVTGEDYVGGLVGSGSGTITNCYSTGTVWGETDVGGFAGHSYTGGTVNNSFWDTESSRQLTSAGGTGKTTGEMQMQSTFAGARWDIMGEAANSYGNTWRLCNERGEYPKLSWQYLSNLSNLGDSHLLRIKKHEIEGVRKLMVKAVSY